MTVFVTALAGFVILAFCAVAMAALYLAHLERMAEIARNEVDV